MIDEERAKAQLEIESAHAATLRVEAALEQQAQSLSAAEQGVKVVTAITLLLHTLFLDALIFLFTLKTCDTRCGPFPSMNKELLQCQTRRRRRRRRRKRFLPFEVCTTSQSHNKSDCCWQELEQLRREVKEARRITMLHAPSKVRLSSKT
jgi:hypothetical protein